MNSDGAQEAPTALRIGASFTLIELLVVIAIIALLAALLLPALNRAKIQGRSVACKNHLHQMSLALRMYVDDSRGQYPYSDCGLLMPPPYYKWQIAIGAYYSLQWSNAPYHCPGYTGAISWQDAAQAPLTSGGWFGSYAYNCFGVSEGTEPDGSWACFGFRQTVMVPSIPTPPVNEAQLAAPSEMIAFTDSLKSGFLTIMSPTPFPYGIDRNEFGPQTGAGLNPVPTLMQNPPQHGVNFNALFCDGHVSQMKITSLMSCSSSAALWNYDHQPHPELWH